MDRKTDEHDALAEATGEELLAEVIAFQEGMEEAQLTSTVDMLMTAPLTIRQLKVLGIIVSGGGQTTSQGLARAIHVSLATVSGLVDKLVESGMVERVPNEHDLRVQNLVATDLAQRTLHDLAARSGQLQMDALRRIPVDDLRALAQGLRALAIVILDRD